MVLLGAVLTNPATSGRASGVGQSQSVRRAVSLIWGSLSAAAAVTVCNALGPPADRKARNSDSFASPRAWAIAVQIASTTAGGVEMAVKARDSCSATVLRPPRH